jgi:hypothetical protein
MNRAESAHNYTGKTKAVGQLTASIKPPNSAELEAITG